LTDYTPWDTKGEEFAYVKALLKKKRLKRWWSILECSANRPSSRTSAAARSPRPGNGDLERFRFGEHKDEAMKVRAAGLKFSAQAARPRTSGHPVAVWLPVPGCCARDR
jgi:hypothetical protein